MFKLTPEQMNILEDAYAPLPNMVNDLDSLLSSASFEQRQKAFRTMLTKDPIGLYRFYNLFQADMDRPSKEAVLDPKVYAGFWDNIDVFLPLLKGDMSNTEKAAAALADIVTKDDDCLSSAEKLIREDKRLEKRYTYYLAIAMGKLESPTKPVIDPNKIVTDILTGKYPEGSDKEALEEIFNTLFPGLGDLLNPNKKPSGGSGDLDIPSIPGIDTDKIWEQIFGDLNKDPASPSTPGTPGNLGDLSGLFPFFPGGTQYPTQPIDDRYHFTVILGYKDALILAERERKGLNFDAMIPELEVAK